MQIISWNIQCGLGVDGHIDLGRIARVIKNMGSADVICLQEVARFNPDLDGGVCHDQLQALAEFFPGYQPVFGVAVDRSHSKTGRRWQFGNAILTKLPILQTFSHQLPQPAPTEAVKHMPRQALEIVIKAPTGDPFRVTTTHLEFHSMEQRLAQMLRLQDLLVETSANERYKSDVPIDSPYSATPRPVKNVLCGDFNAVPDDADYQALIQPSGQGGAQYSDAWRVIKGDAIHHPTCGLFDHRQWPQGPHCRDYFFVSTGMVESVRTIEVEDNTDASDHQPLAMTLAL